MFLAPILPHLTDTQERLDAMIGALADAGAAHILPTPLYLIRGVKELFFTWLRRWYSEQVPAYTELYSGGSRLPRAYRDAVRARVDRALQRHGLPIPDDSTEDKFALLGKRRTPDSAPSQPTLF